MAKYGFHFREYEPFPGLGTTIPTEPGWSISSSGDFCFGSVATGVVATNPFRGNVDVFGSVAMNIGKNSGSGLIVARPSTTRFPGADNIDIWRVVPNLSNLGLSSVGLYARGEIPGNPTTCYSVTLEYGANTVTFRKGMGATTAIDTAAIAYTANTDYYMRFNVTGTGASVTLKVKIWKWSDPEPSTWYFETIDSTSPITISGSAGPCHIRSFPNVDRVVAISYGTNGNSAPVMMSYPDMARWLMSDETKILLAEAGAKGSSNGLSTGTGYDNAMVLAANAEYSTGPTESPPNQAYDDILIDIPSFISKATEFFIGRTTNSFGDAIFANEGGERDNWKFYNWDGRDFRLFVGGKGWYRWDFYRQFTATIVEAYDAGQNRIGFKLRDKSILLDRRASTGKIGGDASDAGVYRPTWTGQVFNVPLTLHTKATHTYVVGEGVDYEVYSSNVVLPPLFSDIRNNGASSCKIATVSAVNAGTDTLTITAHNGVVGGMLVFTAGTPPAPLVLNTYYRIHNVVDANNVQLSEAVYPGPGVLDITGSTTGATVKVDGWKMVALDGATHYGVQMTLDPGSGQLTGDILGNWGTNIFFATGTTIPSGVPIKNAIKAMCVQRGVPYEINNYGGLNNAPTLAVGYHENGDVNSSEIIGRLAASVGSIIGTNSYGRLFCVQMVLPPADYDFELLEDDVDWDSFKLDRLILPSYAEQIIYKRNYAPQKSGLSGSVTEDLAASYRAEYSLTTIAEISSGLNGASNHLLAETPSPRLTYLYSSSEAATEATRIATIRSKQLAVFSFKSRAYQSFIQIGHRVKLTHRRNDFSSGKIGIVVGRNDKMPVSGMLDVLFQIDGKWPTVAAVDSYVGVSDYYQVTRPS